MADYDVNFQKEYNGAGNDTGNFNVRVETLTDGSGDASFTPGETITGSSFLPAGGVFQGWFDQTINGFDIRFLVVEQSASPFLFYVYAQKPDALDQSIINAALPDDLDPLGTPVYTQTPVPVCFAAGTLIATPEGETTVETLQIGDLVSTADGRTVLVKWIGRQTLHKTFTPSERFVPVRVAAGALGEGLPHTDLVLTADHALILDGLAITVGALVNGTTIAYDPIESLPKRVTYYHIETEDHDIILANGAAAETYVDYIQRSAFHNHQEYLDLYGEERTIREMDLPRVSAARLVPPAIKAQLAGETAA